MFWVFRAILDWLPGLRWYASRLLFWPTVLLNRVVYALPWTPRRFCDVIEPGLLLGALPLWRQDVERLARDSRVSAVLNTCEEWEDHVGLYRELDVQYLRVPVVDFTVPTADELRAGARFIAEALARDRTVYVHCKAGRGRSTCMLLAYYALYRGISPAEAHKLIKAKRGHISKKFHKPVFDELWRLAGSGAMDVERARVEALARGVREVDAAEPAHDGV